MTDKHDIPSTAWLISEQTIPDWGSGVEGREFNVRPE
jgi:hypothetical protein